MNRPNSHRTSSSSLSTTSRSTSATAPSTSPATSSSATLPPTAPSIFLSLSSQSFAHLHLSSHNLVHVYVGRVGPKLMVLPLHLHLHPSLLSASAPSILGRLFQHLPSLIADVHLRPSSKQDRPPTLLTTDEVLFSYQFKHTHPSYHVMTRVDPSKARMSHPMVDSEEEEDEEEGVEEDEDDDDEEWGDASEDEEGDEDAEQYRGGKYRAFHVSKHSLYVRAVARREGGVREEEEQKGEEAAAPKPRDEAPAAARLEPRSSPAGKAKKAARRLSDPPQPPQPAPRTPSTVDMTEDDDDFI